MKTCTNYFALRVPCIEDICTTYIKNNLPTIDNFAEISQFAVDVGSKTLIEIMTEYAAQNFKSVVKQLELLDVGLLFAVLTHKNLQVDNNLLADLKDFFNRKESLLRINDKSKDILINSVENLIKTNCNTNGNVEEMEDKLLLNSNADSTVNPYVDKTLLKLYVKHEDDSINVYTINENKECKFIKKIYDKGTYNVKTAVVEKYIFTLTRNYQSEIWNNSFHLSDIDEICNNEIYRPKYYLSNPPKLITNCNLAVINKTIYVYESNTS